MQNEEGEFVLDANGKVKCDSMNRWGDYSTLTVDPSDDCTFWYTTEYQKDTGAYNWHTKIGSFKLPSCR
jgi:hypothetical protein